MFERSSRDCMVKAGCARCAQLMTMTNLLGSCPPQRSAGSPRGELGAAHHRLRRVLHPDRAAALKHCRFPSLRLSTALLQAETSFRHVANLPIHLGVGLSLGQLLEGCHPRLLLRLRLRLELDCLLVRHEHPLQRHGTRAQQRAQPARHHRSDLSDHRQRDHARLGGGAALTAHALPSDHRSIRRECNSHTGRLACAKKLHLGAGFEHRYALLSRLVLGPPLLQSADGRHGRTEPGVGAR
mmetsp:Transcript_45674/g.106541  ORF Transcript_45674/g.106541 Transcript_45674/m.106541 type:complete len:240 (-) Transcript_45674:155-874(-)